MELEINHRKNMGHKICKNGNIHKEPKGQRTNWKAQKLLSDEWKFRYIKIFVMQLKQFFNANLSIQILIIKKDLKLIT